jgi:hypothetical protein
MVQTYAVEKLADFDLADAEISLQDKQRHVVSGPG